MLSVYPSEERGLANFGWHVSRYTFSFGTYYRPQFRGYGALRALNEHMVMPGEEFAAHSHRDLEILTYVVSGSLAVSDSTGHEIIARAGEILRMTAGTGVACREFNASPEHPLEAIQLWITPECPCLAPGYEHGVIPIEKKLNSWCLVGSRDGRSGSVVIHQDVNLYMAQLLPGHDLAFEGATGRQGWVHVVSGSIVLNNRTLMAGDGAAIHLNLYLTMRAVEPAIILLVDL